METFSCLSHRCVFQGDSALSQRLPLPVSPAAGGPQSWLDLDRRVMWSFKTSPEKGGMVLSTFIPTASILGVMVSSLAVKAWDNGWKWTKWWRNMHKTSLKHKDIQKSRQKFRGCKTTPEGTRIANSWKKIVDVWDIAVTRWREVPSGSFSCTDGN
jgi:hypothetical protein